VRTRPAFPALRALLMPVLIAVVFAGCASCAGAGARHTAGVGPVRVVAAENFWGSIAQQVGGKDVVASSIITNPAADPHDYEPTPADAREIAGADLVIVNGVGYDAWAGTLLSASPGAMVINVGDLVGAKDGDNPHLWYDPANVHAFIASLTKDLEMLDPAGDFARSAGAFETSGLKQYDGLVAAIKARYGGVSVGASESIFEKLAPSLGLRLITPPDFLRAISEGTDVSAADKSAIDRQIARHQIKIYVYNSQNATPDVQAQLSACRAQGIPVASITETMAPATDTYQQWQSTQLRGIESALERGSGR
jgi:zinc/manganese transport system substrate-binding protein